MINDTQVSSWIAHIISQIQSSDYAKITCTILNNSTTFKQKESMLYSWWAKRNRITTGPFLKTSLNMNEIGPVIFVTPKQTQYVDRISNADIEIIKAQNLDVILRFGFRIIKGKILGIAKFGVWSYHHGDNRIIRGRPPIFWEMYKDLPEVSATLQLLNSSLDAGQTIDRITIPIENDIRNTRKNLYTSAIAIVLQALKTLNCTGTLKLSEDIMGAIYKTPTNCEMIKFFIKRVGNF